MLKIISHFSQLDFSQLMNVYEQSNSENARMRNSNMTENERYLRHIEGFYTYLRESFFRSPDCVYAVWAPQERYVSALRLEPYRDGLLLEALETAPQERGKGYATALLRALADYLCTTQWDTVYSHVGKKNRSSLAVHAACGFERILEHAVFVDGSVSHNSCTLRLHIKQEGTE